MITPMSKRLITVSKFLSKYLRHEPEALGLTLEPGGWVLIDDLLKGADMRGFPVSRKELLQVVAENDKQRFSVDETETKIRANQGHSTSVDLQLIEVAPPDLLFHGTVNKFLDSILFEGLKKMSRHHVHLSQDVETAAKVGERRGKPVILIVDSAKMSADGYQFQRSENGVWLVDHVPPRYLRLVEEWSKGEMMNLSPTVTPIELRIPYKFMYENFVVVTQHEVFLMLEKRGDAVFCLRFNSLSQMKYGGPNDEAINSHPLYKYGLGPYGLYEVRNSPWIKEQMIANRVHPQHSDDLFNHRRHFIACFKDVTFEVTCDSFEETQMSVVAFTSLLAKQLDKLEDGL